MKIIVDFDNTLGVSERDVDDFLALSYLMKKDVDILAVTTTFGNDKIDIVNEATKKVFTDLDIKIPLYLGDENAGEKIAELVTTYPNEITILSLGATTNTKKALDIDKDLGKKAKFIAMGTIDSDLIIGSKPMKELNFSIDYKASQKVIEAFDDIAIISANNCLDFYVSLEEIDEIFTDTYIREKAAAWFDFHSRDYDISYIIIWDLIASLYLARADLFYDKFERVITDRLDKGLLERDPYGKRINFPILKSRASYIEEIKNIFAN